MRKRSRGSGPFSAVRTPSPGDGPPGDGPFSTVRTPSLGDGPPRDGAPSPVGSSHPPQMSDRNGTFSMSGRSTNQVQQRPAIVNNFAATNSQAVLNSTTSSNQINISNDLVLKDKRGRGCNRGEEASNNLEDRRHISLTPLGGWPDKKVPRTIGSHFRTGLKGGHPNWTEMPKDNKRTLWNRFVSTYVWDPAEDGAIRALWENRAGDSLSEAVFRARDKYVKKKVKPKWCADTHWNELVAYWKSPQFLKRRNAAKANRSKAPRVSHTTGSKTMERAGIEKALEQGIPAIPYIENYADTHMKRNRDDPNAPREWIDPKFKDAHDKYIEECIKDFGEDCTNWPVDIDAVKWMNAIGSPKKGRIMGLSIHVHPEELGFNTRKRSLFPRVSYSSQDSRREVMELRDELDEVKKIAKDATEKCTQLQALVETQKTQHNELMELVCSQIQNNRSNQDVVGSSSVQGEGRHDINEDFNIDDLLNES